MKIGQTPGFLGWKDNNLKYLGCNTNLATVLGFEQPDEIIGLSDTELIDFNEETGLFHHHNDLLALSGDIVHCIHISSYPYKKQLFNIIKQPLLDNKNEQTGIIFHCSPIELNHTIFEFIQNEKQFFPPELVPNYYRNCKIINKFNLSPREIDCIFYILRGKTIKETAAILSLSKRTVETYYENIKNKFGCFTKSELLLQAINNGYMNIIRKKTLPLC